MRLLTISEATISTIILILVIVFIHKLFEKKLSPNVKYFLWLFVALRILMPFKFEMDVKVPIFIYEQIEETGEATSLGDEDTYEQENLNTIVPIPDAFEQGEYTPVYSEMIEDISKIERPETQKQEQVKPDHSVIIQNEPQKGIKTEDIIFFIWLLGVSIFALYITINNTKLLLYLRENRKKLERYCKENIAVYEIKGYNCLAGIFCPAIYIDTEQLKDEVVVKNVICHELQHYKVKDHIWQLVRVICLMLQWYNPLVWYAYFASKKDCELACDYRTVRNMSDAERYTYGNSLLTISSSLNKTQKISVATSMGDDKKFIESRIHTIMQSKYKNAVIFACITVAVICVISIIGAVTVKLLPEESAAEVGSETSEYDSTATDNESSEIQQEAEEKGFHVEGWAFLSNMVEGETIKNWFADKAEADFSVLFEDYNGKELYRDTPAQYDTYSPAVCPDIIYYKPKQQEGAEDIVLKMISTMVEPLMNPPADCPFKITEYKIIDQEILSLTDNIWILPVINGYYSYEGQDLVSMEERLKQSADLVKDGLLPFVRQGSQPVFMYVLLENNGVYRLQRASDMMVYFDEHTSLLNDLDSLYETIGHYYDRKDNNIKYAVSSHFSEESWALMEAKTEMEEILQDALAIGKFENYKRTIKPMNRDSWIEEGNKISVLLQIIREWKYSDNDEPITVSEVLHITALKEENGYYITECYEEDDNMFYGPIDRLYREALEADGFEAAKKVLENYIDEYALEIAGEYYSGTYNQSEVSEISHIRYEHLKSCAYFFDKPKTEAENIVCLEKLYQILCNGQEMEQYLHSKSAEHIFYEKPKQKENGMYTCDYEWIRVYDVHEMSFSELKEKDLSEQLFASMHKYYAEDIPLEYYVQRLLSEGCVVVSIYYDGKYKDEPYAGNPQITDGMQERYWLFVPEADGTLKAYDNTYWSAGFTIHNYVKDNAPEAFRAAELYAITGNRYEHNGSYIEFEDMPQTDVETIACLERLYQITGEKYKFAAYWHSSALPYSGYDDLQWSDNTDKSSIYEYIIIKDVHEMTFSELTNLDSTKLNGLFDSLRQEYMPDMRLDSYVRMILRNDCKVVSIEFDSKYKEDAVIGDPHVGDGTGNVVHWLFVPDTNGQMRAWDWDALYGRFDMHNYVKDSSEIPEEFKSVIVSEGLGGISTKTDWTKEEVEKQFKVKNAPKGWTLIDCQAIEDLYNSYVGVVLYKNEQEEIKLAFMSASGNTSAEWSNESLTAETEFTYGGGGRISYSFINGAGKECSYGLYYKKANGMGYEWLATYLEPYELPAITKTRYEHNGSYIEFEDMPETDAETIISLYKLFHITGDSYESSKYIHSLTGDSFMPIETEPVDISEHRSSYEWIKVHDVQEMTFEEISKIDIYEDVFEDLRDDFAKTSTIDEYVQMILDNGCKVVYIHYTDKYYDEILAMGPQWGHGEKKVYFLLVPEVNGQLKIYASSFNYLTFNTHRYAQRQGYPIPGELTGTNN